MLEKPNLHDDTIATCLQANYEISVSGLEFLPLGNDSSAWVYRVEAEIPYFLKVKKGALYPPSLVIPRFLKDSGIAQVVAPLPTTDGELWSGVGEFALILYPFIEGESGMDTGLNEQQWTELGAALKRIHTVRLPAELQAQVRRETFVPNPKWVGVIRQLQAEIGTRRYENPHEQALAAFWIDRREEIERIVARAEALGRLLQGQSQASVLCHADIHTANVLLEADGRLHIVDWDQVILAPVERDMMFIVGNAVGGAPVLSHEAEWFFKGYGETNIDWPALAYYRYEWVVQDLGDYAERVFLMPQVGDETKVDSVRGFRQLFDAGDVVAAAYESEAHLPENYRAT